MFLKRQLLSAFLNSEQIKTEKVKGIEAILFFGVTESGWDRRNEESTEIILVFAKFLGKKNANNI